MKKSILFLCIFSVLLCVPAHAADAAPETSAGAMILIHGESGRVLAEKNADERMLIASTTKLMTALAAVEGADPSLETEIRPEWTAVEGSSMYLRAGERYTLHELLQGLLLASGNDAALSIAETVDGSVDAFTAHMNRLAEELGLGHTHFANPHGLDAEDHYSTARDLAVLMSRVMQNDTLREILGTKGCSIHNNYYVNHNKLLGKCPGVNGGKTGYTMAAGRCLVSSCERDGLELICVTLSDPDDWRDHTALYDWAYDRYAAFSPSGHGELPPVPVISGSRAAVGASLAAAPVLCVDKDARISVAYSLPPFVFAPVRAGAPAGEAALVADGEVLVKIPLVWSEDAELLHDTAERFIGVYSV